MRAKIFILLVCTVLHAGAQNKEIRHTYVDLGLSVKWATCNIGASSPEGFGYYFAWGETVPKNSFTTKNYAFRKSGSWAKDLKVTKYNTNPKRGDVDGRVRLILSDDAAHVKWGGRWRMPTKDEAYELYSRCKWIKKEINGVIGYKIYGPNGNSIFLPAAGFMSEREAIGQGERSCFWTSSLIIEGAYPIVTAYCLWVYLSDHNYYQWDMDRQVGFPVRPVIK